MNGEAQIPTPAKALHRTRLYFINHPKEDLELTQRDVAEKYSPCRQVISKIENAKDAHISLHSLNKLTPRVHAGILFLFY